MKPARWAPVPGYDFKYWYTSDGQTWRRCRHTGEWTELYQTKNKDGYCKIECWKNSKRKVFLVHRLVAMSWVAIPPHLKGMKFADLEVGHNNDMPWDNRVDNFTWMTKRENMAARWASGQLKKVEPMYDSPGELF